MFLFLNFTPSECVDGTYGANCAQTCHCADGVSCNGTTGQCDGHCAEGYTGDNCQLQCTAGHFGFNCAKTCHCADDLSCNGTTGRCNGSCETGYTGANCQEQCLNFGAKPSCNTTCTTLDPNLRPQLLNVSSYSGGGLFTHTLSWEPVSCSRNDFNIVNYVYKVIDDQDSDVEPVSVEGTTVDLNLSLSDCTRYQFKVAAQISKGIGSYSILPYTTAESKSKQTLKS